jgi:hypothetical protein
MDKVFDIFDKYATDPNKELEGVWVTIGPALRQDKDGKPDPDSAPALKVARSGNKRHGRIVSQLWESNEDVLKAKDDVAEARGEEVTIEAMAKGILLGWKNMSFKGKPLPDAGTEASSLTPEERLTIAKEILAVKDFRDMVAKHANERERFLLAQAKADAGN